MSDRKRVILTLLMQEIGWATDPYFIDADKVAAILNRHAESQNQALQEERDSFGLVIKEMQEKVLALQERVTRLRVARDALDEAATRPASAAEWEDAHNEFMDAVNNLLSSTPDLGVYLRTQYGTQETDPG